MHRVRPRDLPGLHELRPGRDPLPGPRGRQGRAPSPVRTARRATTSLSTRGPFVTQTLIAINVGVYLLQLLMGAGLSARTGWIYEHGVLVSTAIDSSGQVVGVAEETGGGS